MRHVICPCCPIFGAFFIGINLACGVHVHLPHDGKVDGFTLELCRRVCQGAMDIQVSCDDGGARQRSGAARRDDEIPGIAFPQVSGTNQLFSHARGGREGEQRAPEREKQKGTERRLPHVANGASALVRRDSRCMLVVQSACYGIQS